MADWSLPTLSSTYTNFLSQLQARDTDLALGFDGTTSSNLSTGTIRWDSTANRWKKWNGSSWAELTSVYALTGLSTTGNASIAGTFSVTGQTTLALATATTPATADNNTNIATTAFVKAQGYAPLASPTFTGTVTIPSGASIAGYLTTTGAAAAYAPLASPTFTGTVTIPSGTSIASPGLTGTPTAPTAAASTNTTQIATTAFVLGQASSTTPAMNGTAAVGTGTTFARADHVHASDTSKAPLASPTFTGTVTIPAGASISGFAPLASPSLTGTPTAPTAAASTNTTQIATTAFVAAALANAGSGASIQVFTSSGTYTPTAGKKTFLAFVTGGGGGGGGGYGYQAGGGGGGGVGFRLYTLAEMGASAAITVGGGGGWGYGIEENGGTGGTSSIDPSGTGLTLSGFGGGGGVSGSEGGYGGYAGGSNNSYFSIPGGGGGAPAPGLSFWGATIGQGGAGGANAIGSGVGAYGTAGYVFILEW